MIKLWLEIENLFESNDGVNIPQHQSKIIPFELFEI